MHIFCLLITIVIPAVLSGENVSDVSEVGDAKRKAKNFEYVLT